VYDNVKLVYEKKDENSILELRGFKTNFNQGKNGNHFKTLCPFTHGDILKDITVYEYPNSLIIQISSLIRLYHGHSFEILTYTQAKTALESVLELFNLDPQEVKVTNLEFGGNVELSGKVSSYLGYLAHLSRHKVSNFKGETVTFSANGREFMFYDKTKKAKSKKYIEPIPELFKNKNIMRIELKFHLPTKQFKRKIFVSDLIDQNFYIEICDKLYGFFSTLITDKEICYNPLYEGKSKSLFMDILISLGIQSTGLNEVLLAYKHILDNNLFGYANKASYYAFKAELLKYSKSASFNNPTLIDELNLRMAELYGKIKNEADLL